MIYIFGVNNPVLFNENEYTNSSVSANDPNNPVVTFKYSISSVPVYKIYSIIHHFMKESIIDLVTLLNKNSLTLGIFLGLGIFNYTK